MHGLQKYGRIAHDKSKKHLEKHGYEPVKLAPGLWTHKSGPVYFTLIVYDFGTKYVVKQHTEHIIQALQQLYKITIYWEGELYTALIIKWKYKDKYVDILMTGRIEKALHKFQLYSLL